MQKYTRVTMSCLLGLLLLTPPTHAQQTIVESFDKDPATSGWKQSGEPELFRWDAETKALEATWDSSKTNGLFYLPLPTTFRRQDDFSMQLDLTLHDILGGVNPEKPSTFALAFGFFNAQTSLSSKFLRSTGHHSPNLVEFNFFPDTGFGPTVWPAVWSTNSTMNYNGSSDFNLFDLPLNVPLRIEIAYSASNETASVSIATNGVLVGPITRAVLNPSTNSLVNPFTDFELNAVGIESYSDEGQDPRYGGSLLAHATIDNISVITPSPQAPITAFSGRWESGVWRGRVQTLKGWNYQLSGSSDLHGWSDLGEKIPGTGGIIEIPDPEVTPPPIRFYRINAIKSL